MAAANLEDAREALYNNDPTTLLGLRECVWLDIKCGLYPLGKPEGKDELAKDVAAFANTRTGGLLVIGFTARKEHGQEIVNALCPVSRDRANLDQYRQLLDSRIIPALRDVVVDWIDCGNERGVLFIDVPAQPQASQPFVVPVTTSPGQKRPPAVGVPIRRGDGTAWLSPHNIHHLLALGRANAGDAFGRLEKAISTVQTSQRSTRRQYEVGDGAPAWTAPFLRAHHELARQGIQLGEPTTEVYAAGPGVVQHFTAPTEPYGWVLCAKPGERPVAVAGEVWEAVQEAGSGARDGDPIEVIGFPIADRDTTRMIDPQARCVDLACGRWGPGRLRRAASDQDWRWEPVPKPDTTMSASSRNWMSTPTPPPLRIRALATLPWADTDRLAITPARLQALLQALPIGALAGAVAVLSQRRGADLRTAEWVRGPNQNTRDRLSYSSMITAPDGRAALSAEVMMALPIAPVGSTVVTCAELRIEDFTAWAAALDAGQTSAPDALRLSADELFEFLVAAWETATEELPRVATEDPSTLRLWSGVPRVELWASAEQQPNNSGPHPLLSDVVDLTDFGGSDRRDHLTEMMIAIRTVPGLDSDTRRRLARNAMVDMAHLFGFLNVDEHSF